MQHKSNQILTMNMSCLVLLETYLQTVGLLRKLFICECDYDMVVNKCR